MLVLGISALAGTASAQTYPPPSPPPPGYAQPPPPYYAPQPAPMPTPYRNGLIFGFTIGGGAIGCEDCDESLEGIAGSFHIGGMLTPRLALMFDGSSVIHFDDRTETAILHDIGTVAAQIWLTNQIWLKGGLGFGRFTVDDGYGLYETDPGPAILIAGGVEILQSHNFALDIQLRGAAASYETEFGEDATFSNVSLLVGFNWY
jgi:hypothetical protein